MARELRVRAWCGEGSKSTWEGSTDAMVGPEVGLAFLGKEQFPLQGEGGLAQLVAYGGGEGEVPVREVRVRVCCGEGSKSEGVLW